MVIAEMEISSKKFFEHIEIESLDLNFLKYIFNDTKKKMLKLLMLEVGRSKLRKGKVVQFFRWLKEFLFKVDKVNYCVDLVCIVDVTTIYNLQERPSLEAVISKLSEIIENYDPKNMIEFTERELGLDHSPELI